MGKNKSDKKIDDLDFENLINIIKKGIPGNRKKNENKNGSTLL